VELAPSLVQGDPNREERLEARPKAASCPAGTVGDRA
jgi:hypothetical protein